MNPPREPAPRRKPVTKNNNRPKNSSWEGVSRWYKDIVGEQGHYYHRQVVLPNVVKMMRVKEGRKVLDLACGQGVLGRQLHSGVLYTGVDLSPSLIKDARQQSKGATNLQWLVADVTKSMDLPTDFDWVTIILAIQDIADLDAVLANAAKHLKKQGRLLLVMNHPCFRIPRQTQWGIDEGQSIQYRRVDRYMSELKIPIKTEPSKGEKSPTVHSHHRPLNSYFAALKAAGFLVEDMDEWVSDKRSTGPKAVMEDRARAEFPLFLALTAKKT